MGIRDGIVVTVAQRNTAAALFSTGYCYAREGTPYSGPYSTAQAATGGYYMYLFLFVWWLVGWHGAFPRALENTILYCIV